MTDLEENNTQLLRIVYNKQLYTRQQSISAWSG